MIRVENLVKRFGSFAALDDITLEIAPGSIYGLVGSNGAGKSTLMRCIAGIYEAEEGKLWVDSEPVYENPPVKSKIFLVADEPWFIQQSTLYQMKQFYRRFYPEFDNDIYDELVEGFSLPERKRINTFSKGMKRQAAFLLGMAVKPQYLMLDEEIRFFEAALSSLSGYLPELMTDMVINGCTWDYLCEHYHISRTMVAKNRRKAIRELEELYEQREAEMVSYMLS